MVRGPVCTPAASTTGLRACRVAVPVASPCPLRVAVPIAPPSNPTDQFTTVGADPPPRIGTLGEPSMFARRLARIDRSPYNRLPWRLDKRGSGY